MRPLFVYARILMDILICWRKLCDIFVWNTLMNEIERFFGLESKKKVKNTTFSGANAFYYETDTFLRSF